MPGEQRLESEPRPSGSDFPVYAPGHQAVTLLPMENNSLSIQGEGGEFPRRFVPVDADLGSWSRIEPLLKALLARDVSAREGLEDWLLDVSELQACLYEEGAKRYIAMTCDTEDPEKEKAHLHFVEKIKPNLQHYNDQLNRMFHDAPARDDLDPKRYQVYSRSIANEIDLFRQENVPLQTEDEKLGQKYQKVCGAMTVAFEGEEYPLPQMQKFLEVTDRVRREKAWTLTAGRYLDDRDEIDTLLDKSIRVRDKIGRNAGFGNYRDYIHQAKDRFDYTPEDCTTYHDAIEAEIVPLLRTITDKRRDTLGLARLRPWDLNVDAEGREPLRPFETGKELATGCLDIFREIDPELGGYFEMMIEKDLLDLESRKGKAPGGYARTLPEARYPFIFMNAIGTDRDLFVLLHEGGHAFHAFECRRDDLLEYRHAGMEISEVASMSMELFAFRFLERFYSGEDAERSRRSALEGIIRVLPWIAQVDAFQHWLYLHPEHSHEEREIEWLQLKNRFAVTEVDWTGHEDAERLAWHRQLHIFLCPFYYIEYGIAQIGALGLWLKAEQDLPSTIRDYRRALALGGSRPLPELFETAGIRFAFDREVIAPLAQKLREELEIQE